MDHLVVASPTEARHVVDSLAALGVDFIKVYGSLTRQGLAEPSHVHGNIHTAGIGLDTERVQ